MGTAKDIHDLLEGMIERNKDRKLASELAHLQSLIARLQSENEGLKECCLSLVAENTHLSKKVSTQGVTDVQAKSQTEFIEEAGVAFKRRPEGGYHTQPHCPKCRIRMNDIHPAFVCPTCGYTKQKLGITTLIQRVREIR